MTVTLPRGPAGETSDLPPGASPRLHDLCRRAGSAWLRPVLRVRVHGADRIPGTGPLVLVANHLAAAWQSSTSITPHWPRSCCRYARP